MNNDLITYKRDLDGVDWNEMKHTLQADDFDNGRTPAQLKRSFEQSYATCIAYAADRIIGTVRVLGDGVCNAYVVDVWTLTAYRNRGIARTMMQLLLDELQGQHVYLFTDSAVDFYKNWAFRNNPLAWEWLLGTG